MVQFLMNNTDMKKIMSDILKNNANFINDIFVLVVLNHNLFVRKMKKRNKAILVNQKKSYPISLTKKSN